MNVTPDRDIGISQPAFKVPIPVPNSMYFKWLLQVDFPLRSTTVHSQCLLAMELEAGKSLSSLGGHSQVWWRVRESVAKACCTIPHPKAAVSWGDLFSLPSVLCLLQKSPPRHQCQQYMAASHGKWTSEPLKLETAIRHALGCLEGPTTPKLFSTLTRFLFMAVAQG